MRILSTHVRVTPLTIVYGPTGVGKTSLLRAGVLPELRRQTVRAPDDEEDDVGDQIVVVYFSRWQHPDFENVLAGVCVDAIDAVSSGPPLRPGREQLDIVLERARARRVGRSKLRLLLVFDQFDEYLSVHEPDPLIGSSAPGTESERPIHFDRIIARIVNRPDLSANVLIAIKEDELARLDRFRLRIAHLLSNTIRISPLDKVNAERALRKPLDTFNQLAPEAERTTIDPADDPIPRVIAESCETDRIEPAFLQVVMQQLWIEETRIWKASPGSQRRLRLSTLEKGLHGARAVIDNYVDRRLRAALTGRELYIAADVFKKLVNARGEKVSALVEELAPKPSPFWKIAALRSIRPDDPAAGRLWPPALAVLTKLVEARFIRKVADDRYDLFHQLLARSVNRWRREFEFVNGQRTLLIRAVAVSLLVLAVASFFWWREKQAADDATSRRFAENAAQDVPSKDPRLALTLALYAQARDVIVNAIEISQNQLVGHAQQVTGIAFASEENFGLLASAGSDNAVKLWDVLSTSQEVSFRAHDNAVNGVAFRPGRREIITASDDGTARRWSLADLIDCRSRVDTGLPPVSCESLTTVKGKVIPLSEYSGTPGDELWAVASSPDYLVAGGKLGEVKIWDIENPSSVRTLRMQGGGSIVAIAISADNRRVAAAGFDATVQVWDVATGALVATLAGHTNYVYGLSFARDGRLASSSWDGSVIVWDVATSMPRVRLSTSSRTRLWGVGFSTDGSKVAAATRDGVLVIWDAESGDELQRFDGGADVLTSLAFNEDSSIVAAGTASGPIRLFHLARLRDFRGRLTSIGFGSATDRVVGAFEEDPAAAARRSSRPDDHHSMLWNILDGSAVAAFGDAVHQSGDTVVSAGMSPDGGYVVTGSRDKTASVWMADGRRVARPLTSTVSPPAGCKGMHTDVVRAVAIDHDGDQPIVVTGGWDHVVNVWALRDGAFGVVDCFELPDRVFAVTLSPDRRLVIAGGAGTGETGSRLLVRDIRDRKTLYKLELPDAGTVRTAWSIAYHAGTSRVVAGFEDGSLYMWNLHTNTKGNPADKEGVTVYPEHVMLGHSTSIAQVAFNPSGTYVASASLDKSVRVWNVFSGGLELRLGGQSDAIVGVRFERIDNAERLFIVAADGSVRHQEFQWDRIVAMARQRQRPLTDSECERYFPNSRCPAEIPRPVADASR